MQFVMPRVLMTHPQNVVSITIKAGESDRLEPIHDVLLHRRRDRLARRKRQHAALVLVFEVQRVDKPLSRCGVAAQYRGRGIARVRAFFRLRDGLLHAVADRAATAPLTATGEPHDHGFCPC